MDLRDVGLRIKKTREAKGLTQEELAALVQLSPTHISVIERGQNTKPGYVCSDHKCAGYFSG